MIGEILNGYANYFISDSTAERTAKERAAVCAACPFVKRGFHAALLPDMRLGEIQGLYCGDCKCPLSAKVRSKNTKCPQGKW